jgi:hypothetical protein
MLRDGFSSGTGRLLAELAAAIAALDAAPGVADVCSTILHNTTRSPPPAPAVAAAGERAVLADDNRTIMLTLYRGADTLVAVVLSPLHALGLGAELIAAAHRRLTHREDDV